MHYRRHYTMHYYKFNIADWSLSTGHLDLEEEAIYFRLINHYYDTQAPIPLETHSVFRRLRLASQEKANSILAEFFVKTDKGWEHNRCEKVLKEYRKTAKKNKVNGAKGGRPSNRAASSITQTEPSGLPNESQNNPNQELITKNHKPLTNINTGRMARPNLQQVCEEFDGKIANSVNEAESFLNHYESNGWKVGKNPMKSWKHAVTNWITRSKSNATGQSRYKTKSQLADDAAIEALRGL